MSGILFVISGPSGVGKTTILQEVLKRDDRLLFSVSATTREPRAGECNGKDYFFLSREEFEKKIKKDDFLEWSNHFSNYYGTLKNFVKDGLADNKDVILDIDVNGAMQVMKKNIDAVYIFISPDSVSDLIKRLKNRNTENEDKIKIRIEKTKSELSLMDKYDFVVINKTLERSIQEITGIVISQRCRIKNNTDFIKQINRENQ